MMPKNLTVYEILPKANNYIAYLGMASTAVNEECCHRMKHLALALNRAEQALRYSLEIIVNKFIPLETETGHIEGTQAIIGRNTTEWGGYVALWGILPLWRAAPPPDTVLKLRRPTPSDCWPFRGSYGEVTIEMPKTLLVSKISVEHIRPDTARSAPKHFVIYGVSSNGTWIKGADGIYEYNKPAKQYFKLDNRNVPFQQIVFRVLSNQGNMNYTCIYRLRFYMSDKLLDNKLV
ncbi:SUN domain-containing protein 5-like [Melitaea cinxia]|uniref:SUN domain-containing protein 5-like n=1 Tax=Melitaea cinxia TaxID=113334 RepID=UPI001E270D1E|nr:SUN domain-containing protein 5-like [Melitaea cinxia]